jgi:hypothetical protein
VFLNTIVNDELNMSAYYEYPTIAYQKTWWNIAHDFFLIYYSNNTNRVEAMECGLYFCGQTYNTSVVQGVTTTTAIATWGQLTPAECCDVDYVLEGGPLNLSLAASPHWVMMVNNLEVFRGAKWVTPSATYYPMLEDPFTPSPAVQAVSMALETDDEMSGMTTFMTNMAIGLTNRYTFHSFPSMLACLSGIPINQNIVCGPQ